MPQIILNISGTIISHTISAAHAVRLLDATKPMMFDGEGNTIIDPTNAQVAQWIGRDFIEIQKKRVMEHERRVAAANDGVTTITATED